MLLKAGLDGYPVGDLNWFPDRVKSWRAEGDAASMMAYVKQRGIRHN